MDIGHLLLVLAGLAVIGFALWSRSGRTRGARWWRDSEASEAAVLLVLPGVGLILVLAGLLPLADEPDLLRVLLGLLLAVAFVLVLWGGLRLPIPGWFVPGWHRADVDRRRAARPRRGRQ